MNRPDRVLFPTRSMPRGGYTLVEILVAVTLTLIMMLAVVQIFGLVGNSIANSRAILETADRLRAATARLRLDLEGVTAVMLPPRRVESNEGYFEYTEGPGNANTLTSIDSTVGDIDDILLFTTRSNAAPFVGKFGAGGTVESHIAEVAWFVRGRTLYRRVLLVAPSALQALDTSPPDGVLGELALAGYYNNYDVSVRLVLPGVLAPNTLADLTKPECRFAHARWPNRFESHPHCFNAVWPSHWQSGWPGLGLPTLRECSHPSWKVGRPVPTNFPRPNPGTFDAWQNPHPDEKLDPETGAWQDYMGPRVAEDVILTNVIGFDVKAWDPGAPVMGKTVGGTVVALLPHDTGYPGDAEVLSLGAYVDLGYANDPSVSTFSGVGDGRSGLSRVYDTWSFHYEHDGENQDASRDSTPNLVDEGTNGFDDDGNGTVDDVGELEMPPPYAVPLRGIQVKIRVFEPDSRQIREVTIVQDFLQ